MLRLYLFRKKEKTTYIKIQYNKSQNYNSIFKKELRIKCFMNVIVVPLEC